VFFLILTKLSLSVQSSVALLRRNRSARDGSCPKLSRPWSVIEIPGGFRVDDASGKGLGYFYAWSGANAAHLLDDDLTAEEARRMAEEFAKMPKP
jgi:hypothetical protein